MRLPWHKDEPTAHSVASVDADTLTAAAVPPPRGRNLWMATVVGLALFIGVLAAARLSPLALAITLCVVTFIAVIEWRAALLRHGRRVSLWPISVAIVGMTVATWYAESEGLIVALLVACAGVVAWRVVDERIENTLADSLAAMFTLLWIPFLASFVLLMEQAHNGWQRVWILLVAVSGNDTGALFAGMLFGKRKLAPRISPNKTWEGAIGGAIVGAGASAGFAYWLFDGAWLMGLLVGLAVVVASVVGDLAESAIKRDMSIKDMSSIVPGHGGVLDRIDSLLVAAPVAYVCFAIAMGTS